MTITKERCLEMLRELHQMKLQLDSCSDLIKDMNNNTMKSVFLKRKGSVCGRRNLVKTAIRKLGQQEKSVNEGVVVYLTSCGVLRRAYDKCKGVVHLLEAFRIKFEIRDLNISGFHVEELADKLKLSAEFQKDFIFESLPLIYVDGYFLGNEKTIIELNDAKKLERILEKYKTKTSKCSECGNVGYVVCRVCHGSRRHFTDSGKFFGLELRCSFCDVNGISRCQKCF